MTTNKQMVLDHAYDYLTDNGEDTTSNIMEYVTSKIRMVPTLKQFGLWMYRDNRFGCNHKSVDAGTTAVYRVEA